MALGASCPLLTPPDLQRPHPPVFTLRFHLDPASLETVDSAQPGPPSSSDFTAANVFLLPATLGQVG